MADSTPPSNNKTAKPSGGSPALQDPTDSINGAGGALFSSYPRSTQAAFSVYVAWSTNICRRPVSLTSIYLARSRRHAQKIQWSEGSPPGIYWNGDDNPYQPFLLKDIQEDDARDNIAGSSGLQATAVTSIVTPGFESTSDDSSDSGSSAPSPLTPTSSNVRTPLPSPPYHTFLIFDNHDSHPRLLIPQSRRQGSLVQPDVVVPVHLRMTRKMRCKAS